MRSTNKNLTILSEAEQAALYEIPDFDDDQRLKYVNLTPKEQALVNSFPPLSSQIHCALQISYFKAKHLFFRFDWDEVQEDINFIIQEYFPGQIFYSIPTTNYQYYTQCCAIAAHFDYKLWSKEFEPLLYEQATIILRRDVSPQFIAIELLKVLRDKKIMRPGYTTLQTIISCVLKVERERLRGIINDSLSENDKELLQQLLFEEETLSGLADLKQSAKDFKARMISAEREKFLSIKPLYKLAKELLPKLKLSQQNIQYYASLIDYYTVYDLRKKLKSEQTYLYLLCYIMQRYHQLNDNLIDAFCFNIKQCEDELTENSKEAYAQYAIDKQNELSIMKQFAHLFVKKDLSNQLQFGEVRKKAFSTILPEEELLDKFSMANEKELKEIDFKWKAVDSLFHRYKLQLRPLVMAMDFSSTIKDSHWLSAISWLKKVFQAEKKTRSISNQRNS